MDKESNKFFQKIATANENTVESDVKNIFIWYDLLAYAVPFQLIFIIVYFTESYFYPFTMFALIIYFILRMFSIKNLITVLLNLFMSE